MIIWFDVSSKPDNNGSKINISLCLKCALGCIFVWPIQELEEKKKKRWAFCVNSDVQTRWTEMCKRFIGGERIWCRSDTCERRKITEGDWIEFPTVTVFQKFQQGWWELLKSKLLIKAVLYLIGRGCHSNFILLSHWLGAAHQEAQSQGKHLVCTSDGPRMKTLLNYSNNNEL